MKRFKLAAAFLVLTVLFAPFARAVHKRAGTTGAQFLKIPVGARNAALGGAYAAVSDNAYGLYGNPGGIGLALNNEITFQHNEWLLDIRHDFLGLIHHISKEQTLGVSFSVLTMGDMDRTEEDAGGFYTGTTGKFDARDMSIGLSYAYKPQKDLSFGVTAKLIKSRIDSFNAQAAAFDIGFIYKWDRNITLGASVTNLGTKMKFINQKDKLPLTYRTGIAYARNLSLNYDIILTCDLVKPIDNRTYFGGGAEFIYKNQFYLRTGYNTNIDYGSGISAGLGFKFDMFNIDYTWTPSENLGHTHRVSATVKYGQ